MDILDVNQANNHFGLCVSQMCMGVWRYCCAVLKPTHKWRERWCRLSWPLWWSGGPARRTGSSSAGNHTNCHSLYLFKLHFSLYIYICHVFQWPVQSNCRTAEPRCGDNAFLYLDGDSLSDGSRGQPVGLPALLYVSLVRGETEILHTLCRFVTFSLLSAPKGGSSVPHYLWLCVFVSNVRLPARMWAASGTRGCSCLCVSQLHWSWSWMGSSHHHRPK